LTNIFYCGITSGANLPTGDTNKAGTLTQHGGKRDNISLSRRDSMLHRFTVTLAPALLLLLLSTETKALALNCGGKVRGTVTLTSDMNCPRGHGLYVDNNAVLDCAGYKIVGNEVNDSYGIYIRNVNNAIVQNCTVEHFEVGVRLRDARTSTVQNTISQNNTRYGIEITGGSTGNVIQQNTVFNNNDEGIHISGPSGSTPGHRIINNTVDNNNLEGIYLLNSNNNEIAYNFIQNHITAGIYIKNSRYNRLTGNTITNDFVQLVAGSTANTFDQDVILGGRLKFENASGNTITAMSVQEQGGRPSNAYDFTLSSNNTITDSAAIDPTEYAIRAADSSVNNQFIRFTATPTLRCYIDNRSSVSITGPNDEPLQCP
jgi:parallel beta-helix repeat protein